MRTTVVIVLVVLTVQLVGCSQESKANANPSSTATSSSKPLEDQGSEEQKTDKDEFFKEAKPFDPSSYEGSMASIATLGDNTARISLYAKEGSEFKPYGELEIKGKILLGAEGVLGYPETFLRIKLVNGDGTWRELERKAIQNGRLFIETRGENHLFTIYGFQQTQYTAVIEPGLHVKE